MNRNWIVDITCEKFSENITFSFFFQSNMPRTQHSRKHHSTSFTKFVARLQRTFSYKNVKSSTPLIQQQVFVPPNPSPLVSLIHYKRIFHMNY